MRRSVAAMAIALLTFALGTGCGSEEKPPPSSEPKVIEVTFEGDSVNPSGDRVDVPVGQDVELRITADAPGEIHVHLTPEQALKYSAGESTVTIQGIDQPGTVDVESHHLDKVIVQLEVS